VSPFRITARRTIGYARNAYTTAVVVGAYLAAAASCFAFNLNAAEGGRLTAAVVWASSVSPILPFLAAFLGMDTWSEERRSGRMDVLLASPVSETDLTVGKFFGTWVMTLVATMLSLVASVVLLRCHAPAYHIAPLSFVAAFAVLALQGALWCAVAVVCSAAFRRSAVAACATVALLVALPRGVWAGMMAWSAGGRTAYGEMPLDAHVVDIASGSVSGSVVISYVVLTACALFWAVTFVELRRLVGRGARRARAQAVLATGLSGVLSVLLVLLALRMDFSFDIPVAGKPRYSERTLGILSEARGDVSVTCFMPRSDGRYRQVAHSLRSLAREAAARGGVRMAVRFVDPSWDIGEAARLVRSGVKPGTVVFAYGRRTAVLPLDEGFGERLFASAILRITVPPQHRVVRWTCGHGETAFDDYGAFGMSDIARELSRDGYLNQTIDLSSDAQIPSDCALIVIAGAREDFSRVETARLDGYLKQGGRLLVLMNSHEMGGVSTLLAGWGINATPLAGAARTVSGCDVIVSDFSDHSVAGPLKGTSLLLEKPVAFTPSAAVDVKGAADRIDFTALAKSGADCVAAIVERGEGTGDDLDFRPTRIVAIGDDAFVMNAQLATQANANRDFFLNAVAYLSGTDAMTSSGQDGELLVTGMDRAGRRRFAIVGACFVPVAVGLFMFMVAFRRKRRE